MRPPCLSVWKKNPKDRGPDHVTTLQEDSFCPLRSDRNQDVATSAASTHPLPDLPSPEDFSNRYRPYNRQA
jgi:hypothetical protein